MNPKWPIARRFQIVGLRHLEDASILFAARQYEGTVYLAGYATECSLKMLLLELQPSQAKANQLAVDEFRGRAAHDIQSLRVRYLRSGGPVFPRAISRELVQLSKWTTSRSYDPRSVRESDARTFLAKVRLFTQFADGRL